MTHDNKAGLSKEFRELLGKHRGEVTLALLKGRKNMKSFVCRADSIVDGIYGRKELIDISVSVDDGGMVTIEDDTYQHLCIHIDDLETIAQMIRRN